MAGNSIVIKRIKKGGHAHHGGAWKVAYADFVTAMMAFFLLLWLLATSSEETLTGIADYFAPTVGVQGEMGIGFKGGNADTKEGREKEVSGKPSIMPGAVLSGPIVRAPEEVTQVEEEKEKEQFTLVENSLSEAMKNDPELKDLQDSIIIDQTPEGLRIQITDKKNRPMFRYGGTMMYPHAKIILAKVTEIVRFIPNYLSINGHTSITNEIRKGYTDWELSADRGNTVRRFMQENGVDGQQVARVTGKADFEPLEPGKPNAPENDRISIILLRHSVLPYHRKAAPDSVFAEENVIDKPMTEPKMLIKTLPGASNEKIKAEKK